jgi:hypothetical protein
VDPSPRLLPFLRPSEHQDAAEFLKEKQCFIEPLKQKVAKSQNRMKMQADSNRNEQQFQVGEKVLLKLQPYVEFYGQQAVP